jgi:hypothetical protein
MALDGWLFQIKVLGTNETPNMSSYFSGHYQCYGVNVHEAMYVCFALEVLAIAEHIKQVNCTTSLLAAPLPSIQLLTMHTPCQSI